MLISTITHSCPGFSTDVPLPLMATAFFQIKINKINQSVSQILVQSLGISRLDDCNGFPAGAPLSTTKLLQLIQNAATRPVFNQQNC